jgi:hypothetical protein
MKKEQIQTRNRKTNNKIKKSITPKSELIQPKLEHSQIAHSLIPDASCSLDLGMAPFLNGAHFFGMPAAGFQQPGAYADLDPSCHYGQQQGAPQNPHYNQQ